MNLYMKKILKQGGYINHYNFTLGDSFYFAGENNFFLGFTHKRAGPTKKTLEFGIGNFDVVRLQDKIFGDPLKNYYSFMLQHNLDNIADDKTKMQAFVEENEPARVLSECISYISNSEPPPLFDLPNGIPRTAFVFHLFLLQAASKRPPTPEEVLNVYKTLEFKSNQMDYWFEKLIAYLGRNV